MTLDEIEPVTVQRNDHANERRTLATLQRGLWGLTNGVYIREAPYREIAKKMIFVEFGQTDDGPTRDIDMMACVFHWFGVSLCNYVRLVGFIRGLEKGEFTRADLSDAKKSKDNVIAKAINKYVESIPELESVLIWRNKVFGHFAITAPRHDDNIATLDMSVVLPVSFVAPRYVAGEMQMIRTNATGTHTSELPPWSVTEVYEALTPRFWPNHPPFPVNQQTPPSSESQT